MLELKSKMIKCVVIFCGITISHSAYGQWDEFFKAFGTGSGPDVEFGCGLSTLHQTNLPNPLLGFNLKYGLRDEYPSSFFNINLGKSIFFIRASYYFQQGKQTSGNFNATTDNTLLINPIAVPYKFKQSVSYLMFDIREDYYFYTQKDEQFSLYGGWLIGVNIPFYKGDYEISPYDQINYVLDTEESWKKNRKESEANYIAGLNFGIERYVGVFGNIYIETSAFFNLKREKYLTPDFTISSRFFLELNLGYRYEF